MANQHDSRYERELVRLLREQRAMHEQHALPLYQQPVERYSHKSGLPLPVDTVMRLLGRKPARD